jgi:hypothetical protein
MRLAEFVEENAENQSSMTDFHNCESLNEAYEFIQEFNEHRDSASGDKQGEVHSQRETKQERKQKSRLLTIQGYANKMLPLLPDGNTPEPDEDKIYETLGFAEDWRIHYRKKKETIAERAARVEEGMKEIAV